MKTSKVSFALLAYASTLLCLEANTVTLQVHTYSYNGPIITNSEVSIASNEVAEVAARNAEWNANAPQGYWIKDGVTNALPLAANSSPSVIAGPAVIRLTSSPGDQASAYCTLKIKPESFPPGNTLVIPAGSGAYISLEASPDLVIWTNSVPGAYTNMTGNLFFRIRADRITP